MPRSRLLMHIVALAIVVVGVSLTGCVNVKAPEEINIGSSRGRKPIDTSRLPPTGSHEEARQKLAAAYERIDYLESEIRNLKEDKEELKEDRDEYKRKYKRAKDRYDD